MSFCQGLTSSLTVILRTVPQPEAAIIEAIIEAISNSLFIGITLVELLLLATVLW